LFPKIDWSRPMDETIHQFIPEEKHGLLPDERKAP
jgi:hypothetical protein